MRKTLLSILFLLLLAVPAIAQKPAPAASAPAPAQTTPAATAPVKPSEIEDLKIENLKLKLSLYTQHKVDLQREEDSVNQDGEKLAEQIIADHPGHHLDFKTLTIVSDAPAEAAKPAATVPPAALSSAPAETPKK